jgi:hypothetical protein
MSEALDRALAEVPEPHRSEIIAGITARAGRRPTAEEIRRWWAVRQRAIEDPANHTFDAHEEQGARP